MNKKIDVIIIGGGIGGLMSAYQLMETNPMLNIVMLEKGLPINRRVCPIITGKVDHCIHCRHCAIMEGMAGCRSIFRWKIYHIHGIRRMADRFYARKRSHEQH
jgi:uncharacterized FAD-dependent dehydrogenase